MISRRKLLTGALAASAYAALPKTPTKAMIPGLSSPIASPNYCANAVNFDGSTYLTRGAGLTGAADSKLLTGSLWVKMDSDGTIDDFLTINSVLASTDTTATVIIRKNGFNQAVCIARNTILTTILSVSSSTNSITVAGGWINVLYSFDLTDTGKRHLYLNDVSDLGTVTTYTDDTIDFTGLDASVGATTAGGSTIEGDLADVWFQPGLYIDFSIAANRRKFITAAGKPAYLGPTGNLPTGTPPIAYFSGPTASWETNKGTGGGFTENGTLTTSATSPSGC